MDILGIETSCDETAAAVVRDGREVLSNVVYTQIPLHQPYGGVVPEIASRAHVEKIREVVGEAMKQYEMREEQRPREVQGTNKDVVPRNHISAVAVTYGPGLSPALIVGLNAAKGLAKSLGVPLIGINHIEAHLHTPFLFDADDKHRVTVPQREPCSNSVSSCPCVENPEELMPALGLAISGGNTMWVDMPEYGKYEVIGETLDDAAGEAFDKAAKLLGLGYPGGLKIDRISAAFRSLHTPPPPPPPTPTHNSNSPSPSPHIPFPKGRPRDGVTALAGLPAELCVSFSGLKTALLRYVQQHPELLDPTVPKCDFGGYEVTPDVARVVASYQEAIADAVADRTRAALRRQSYRAFVLGGGVSLNSRIREKLTAVCADAHVPLLMAKPKYTGDNGAMVAALAYYRRNHVDDAMSLDANPCLQVGE